MHLFVQLCNNFYTYLYTRDDGLQNETGSPTHNYKLIYTIYMLQSFIKL
jgi:hypothetical protein